MGLATPHVKPYLLQKPLQQHLAILVRWGCGSLLHWVGESPGVTYDKCHSETYLGIYNWKYGIHEEILTD